MRSRSSLPRRRFLQTLSATGAGLFLGGTLTGSVPHTLPVLAESEKSSVYAPGEPASPPSVILHGQVVASQPNVVTLQLGKEKILVKVEGITMWRRGSGIAREAQVGEEAIITGDYMGDEFLHARHVWLNFSRGFLARV